MSERTMIADMNGRELFVGDTVRADIDIAFQEFGVHGRWAEYEITKAPGGYALSYLRSESGTVLPFGYLSCFITEFDSEKLPDMKRLIFATAAISHPSLLWVDDQTTLQERRQAFGVESERRRASSGKPTP